MFLLIGLIHGIIKRDPKKPIYEHIKFNVEEEEFSALTVEEAEEEARAIFDRHTKEAYRTYYKFSIHLGFLERTDPSSFDFRRVSTFDIDFQENVNQKGKP